MMGFYINQIESTVFINPKDCLLFKKYTQLYSLIEAAIYPPARFFVATAFGVSSNFKERRIRIKAVENLFFQQSIEGLIFSNCMIFTLWVIGGYDCK